MKRRYGKETLILLAFLIFSSTRIFGANPVNTDYIETVVFYKTGSIDPAAESIPLELNRNVSINPDRYLPVLVMELKKTARDDFEAVKRFHDWMTAHIAFDYDYFFMIQPGTDMPNEILTTGKTCSKGFAGLLARMAEIAGIQVRTVHGISKFFRQKDGDFIPQYWNIITIEGGQYICDVSQDKRLTSFNNQISALGAYSDNELFPSPEFKIRLHYPDDPADQLLEPAVQKDEYLKTKRFEFPYYTMGIELIDTGFSEQETALQLVHPGEKVVSLVDNAVTANTSGILKLKSPSHIILTAKLSDLEGNEYDDHILVMRETNETVIEIAPPAGGYYRITVFAREIGEPSGTRSAWQRVYAFYINEEGEGLGLEIEKGRVYLTGADLFFGLSIRAGEEIRQNGTLFFPLSISFPTDVNITFQAGDPYPAEAVIISYVSDTQRIFYFPLMGRETPVPKIELYAKKKDESVYRFKTAFLQLPHSDASGRPTDTILRNTYIFEPDHQKYPIIPLPADLGTIDGNGAIEITVENPYSLDLNCLLKDGRNQVVKNGATYNREGSLYTFRFAPQDPGPHTAKIYIISPDELWIPLISLSLSGRTAALFPPDEIKTAALYKKNAYYAYGIELENEEAKDSFAGLVIRSPEDVTVTGQLTDIRGETIDEKYLAVSTPTADRHVYYLSAKEAGIYIFTAWAKRKNAAAYSDRIFEYVFEIEKPEAMPPAGTLIFTRQFHEKRLKFIDFTKDSEGKFTVLISAGENVLDCRVKDENNNQLPDYSSTDSEDGVYRLTFTTPSEGKNTGKVYVHEENDTWSTVCYFLMK